MYANVEATLAVSIVFPLLATIAVLLRFLTRRSQKSTLSWDDWLLIPVVVWGALTNDPRVHVLKRICKGYNPCAGWRHDMG